jgi:hypothetical protein
VVVLGVTVGDVGAGGGFDDAWGLIVVDVSEMWLEETDVRETLADDVPVDVVDVVGAVIGVLEEDSAFTVGSGVSGILHERS